jgi:hypothetical protein
MEKLNSQERILAIVEKLVEKPIDGMSNRALAFELKTLEANICRDLKILENHGWIARSRVSGKWRMSPKFGGFAGTIVKYPRQSRGLEFMNRSKRFLMFRYFISSV